MPPAGPPKGTQSRGRRRRREPPRQTAAQRRSTQAQQAAYVSQGKAVERAANRQRRAQPKPLSRTPPRRMHRAQAPRAVRNIREAQQRPFRGVRRAATQTRGAKPLSRKPVRPERVPSRRETQSLGARIVRALDIYGFSGKDRGSRGGKGTASLAATQVRGVSGGLPARAALGTAAAIAEKPSLLKDVPPTLGKYAIGAPAGLVETAVHPRRAASGAVKDYARRYGALARGDDRAFIDRIKKEGVTPELLDIGGSATGAGAVGGRVLQKVAVRMPRGSRLNRIATQRRNIRVSGDVSRPQEVSDNLVRNVVRAAVDAQRGRVQRRRARREDAPIEVRQAQERGELTYVSRGRQRREQRVAVAREKGVTLARMKAQQQREQSETRKNLNSLSREERRGFNFAMQFGATTPAAARALAKRRQVDIAAHRGKLAKQRPGYAVSRRADQAPELRHLEQNAEKIFTPKLRQVVRAEQARERRVAAGDPGVDLEQAQLRRYQPLAAALGIERRRGEDVEDLVYHGSRVGPETIMREGLRAQRPTDLPGGEMPEGVYLDPQVRRAATFGRHIYGVDRRTLEKLTDDPDLVGSLVARGDIPPEAIRYLGRVGEWDEKVITRVEREAAETGARRRGETNAEFLRRVRKAAREAGLERPGYVRSEEQAKGAFSAFAVGGRKATEVPKAYSGSLLRQGIESLDPEVHVRGVARGIKRREQWNMVARNLEKHAVPEVGGRPMRDRGIIEMTRDLENAGVDMGSVGFWNPRKFYEASRRAARDTESKLLEGDDREFGDAAGLREALKDAVATPAQVELNPEKFANTRGWSVVPKEVLDEIEADTRPSGPGGRIVDVTRGKISRVLLGNPAWLGFQVASNAFLTGLAGVGPVDMVKAQRWWRNLPDADKEALGPELGIHGWYDEQTRLGATANNHFVNFYRALKQTGFWQKARKGNPLDALFRADNAQNNFFRKAVLYNEAKREAYRRMGDGTHRMMRAQGRMQRILKMDPKDRITAAAKDPKVFEDHARAVRDFLGDYTSYTSKERRTLGRYMLFYGFLRHSLRLTFYTLPVKHPLMTAIGLELGKMHDDELRRIFGVDVPEWEQANAFVDGRKFDVGRLNPFFNAVQFQGPQSLLMLGTPLLQMGIDQLAKKNVAFDQPWRVGGSGSYVSPQTELGPAVRGKIALAQALKLSPYYRAAEAGGVPGVKGLEGRQTNESSLLFPDPIEYKTPEPAARNVERIREQRAKSTGQIAEEMLFPVRGEAAAPAIRSAREYAESQGETVRGEPEGPVDPAVERARRRARRMGSRGGTTDAALERARRRAARLGGG